MFDALGGRVKHWITLNEPYCSAFLGYYEGRMAPGLRDFSAAVLAAYYLYVGHGLAVRCFRESGLQGEIGIALNLMGRLPYSSAPQDQVAACSADGYLNRWFLDPLFKGGYPVDMITWYRKKGVRLPSFSTEHLALINQKIDFLGINYYNDFQVLHDSTVWPLEFRIQNSPNQSLTDRQWPITEKGLTHMLLRLTNEYGIQKLLISENGASFHDVVSLDDQVHDGARTDYLHRHILAMHSAISHGAPVKGYFVWSLYDNFEWGCGYSSRFGIVHVDYATQKRTIKDSGKWYSAVIAQNSAEEF